MNLRLRFIHTRYPHWCSRSGFTQLVRHLDPQQFTSVLDGASDSDADLPAWLNPARPWLRRRIAAGGMPWYKLSDLMAELRALPGAASGRYQVVHFLDGEHAGQFLPRWLSALPGPRPVTVASFHQPHPLQHELINPALARRFDHITVLSPSQIPFFEAHMPRARIHLFPHGVDTDFFRPDDGARAHNGALRCITVGHWLRDWEMIRAMTAQFPQVRFDVVSAGPTGLEHAPNVTHHRGIPDDALARLYRDADVLLLPLIEATANNALLEGIASGLPVITTDLAGTRFHLAGQGALLTPAGDVGACAAALRALRDDPERRLALGRAARARAGALAWPAVAAQFGAFYRTVTEARTQRRAWSRRAVSPYRRSE